MGGGGENQVPIEFNHNELFTIITFDFDSKYFVN